MNPAKNLPLAARSRLLQKSNAKGFAILLGNWLMIAAFLVLPCLWPGPITVLISLIGLGGRQLGLAILMHDCSHRTLFADERLNDILGQWLCAAPVFVSLPGYRSYHLKHHQLAGSPDDPDIQNYLPYPVSRESLKRKLIRDLSGKTGFKLMLVILRMGFGFQAYELSYKSERRSIAPAQVFKEFRKNLLLPVIINTMMAVPFFMSGYGLTFCLWPLAWFTTYMAFSRIRNAAEHASVPDINSKDPLKNTRTTLVSWWERLTIAPNYVNFHLEHHLLPSVPGYRLAEMHALLKKTDGYRHAEVCRGYGEVFQKLLKH